MIKEIVDTEYLKFEGEKRFVDLAKWVLNWSAFRDEDDQ
mgnify:CR=1 FL=1